MAMAIEPALLIGSSIFYSDAHLTAGFTPFPIAPGHVIIEIPNTGSFAAEDLDIFCDIMLIMRRLSKALSTVYAVRRCALVFDGTASISLIPLHGLGEDWKPITHEALEYHDSYPGYITSKNGPKLSDADLDNMRNVVTAVSGLIDPDPTFLGTNSDQNLFARIIRGEVPSWKVWEDSSHVAFLTPFANTPGYTVLVPRKRLNSDILSLDERNYADILRAAHSCAEVLMGAFQVSRCGFIFEGYEIDYAHIKLIPIHGRSGVENSDNVPRHAEFQMTYQGFVTSQPGPLLSDLDAILDATNAMREALECEGLRPIRA